MKVLARPIKFEEVDAAGIVFFARFVAYAHEAMEDFFSDLDGGYATLILKRRVGLPAVNVAIDFKHPVRYGDTLLIETQVDRIGGRSAVFRYVMKLAATGAVCCELKHTVVTTNLDLLASTDMPADVRALLMAHLANS